MCQGSEYVLRRIDLRNESIRSGPKITKNGKKVNKMTIQQMLDKQERYNRLERSLTPTGPRMPPFQSDRKVSPGSCNPNEIDISP
jgi:hypothetical protein